jgi:RNA polymerase sigma-70 factor, ECF subfamily
MRSEQDIVCDLAAGKPGAFDEMYGLYADRIWRLLVRLTRNRTLAEDLFQETWLAAASHAHHLRPDSALLRWLYTIARNAHRMSWRKNKADLFRCQELEATSVGARPHDDSVAAHIDLERAQAAMLRLPDAHREVLVLCGLEELSSEDAAAILGLSREAVRQRLSRARAQLTALLGENADEKETSP